MKAFELKQLIREEIYKTLNEVELEQDIESELKQLASQMQSQVNAVKPSPNDGELEEGVFTIAALITGAPGLLTFLGKAADGVADIIIKGTDSDVFKADTYKTGGSKNLVPTLVGTKLIKAGHSLEEIYIDSIGGWLQKAFPSRYKGQVVTNNKSLLYDDAHKVYATMLAGALVASAYDATHAVNTIVAGFKGGTSALKASEIVSIAQKVAAA